MKRYYPVIFTKENVGFSTSAIDLDGCFSQGDSFEEAYLMTQDAIGLFLDGIQNIPVPTDPAMLTNTLKADEFICVVEYDDLEYKKRHSSRSVKKTLTIPQWLNEEAERQHVNFSGVLQEALKNKLNLV